MNDLDWAAVSRTIQRRMEFLNLKQNQLIERCRLSKVVVGELQNNSAQRRRSPYILQALSVALGLDPAHLEAVAHNRMPPPIPHPTIKSLPTPHTARDPRHLNLNSSQVRHLQHSLEHWSTTLAQLADSLAETERILGIKPDVDPSPEPLRAAETLSWFHEILTIIGEAPHAQSQ